MVLFRPSSSFLNMTLNDLEWPFYVKLCFAQVRLEFFAWIAKNNC